jgi:DNA-binding NtrC family response regulator
MARGEAGAASRAGDAPADRAGGAVKLNGWQARSGRVLIADDDPPLLELLDIFLTGQGYVVATVATGAQVLHAVPTFKPDVILVDMLMPGLSGTDVLDALRRAGVTMPVILMSGHQATAREGFFGVLQKPFKLQGLADVVASAMDHGRTPDH